MQEVFGSLGVKVGELGDFSNPVGRFSEAKLPPITQPEEVAHCSSSFEADLDGPSDTLIAKEHLRRQGHGDFRGRSGTALDCAADLCHPARHRGRGLGCRAASGADSGVLEHPR